MATFTKGMTVEVCPYMGMNAYHYLAHIDGERGVVLGTKNHGKGLKVSVKLAYNRATVDFPAKAIKPVEGK